MADSAQLLRSAGLVSAAQIKEAQKYVKAQGGTLGLHLVRLGAIAPDALARFYHKQMRVPLIDRARLSAVTPNVLKLLPSDLAAELRVIPIDCDREDNLTLAMADPAWERAASEVGFFTGLYIVRGVASEEDIEWALTTHYGIAAEVPSPAPLPRPTSGAPRTKPKVSAAPKTKTASGPKGKASLPPRSQPTPAGASPKQGEPSPAAAAPSKPMVVSKTPVLLTRVKEESSPSIVVLERPKSATEELGATTTSPGEQHPLMVELEHAVEKLRRATEPEEVGAQALSMMALLCERAVFWIIKKRIARPWGARGAAVSALEALEFPIDAPSLFRTVILSGEPLEGKMATDPVLQLVQSGLGASCEVAVLAPVITRNRPVALLYGDQLRLPPPQGFLKKLTSEMGTAYERMLLRSKSSG